jgi:hypothetical protein
LGPQVDGSDRADNFPDTGGVDRLGGTISVDSSIHKQVIIIFLLAAIILGIYLYGKWYMHNASTKGLPYTPPKQYRDLGNDKRKSARFPAPPGPPPPPPPPLPSSYQKDLSLSRDEEVSPHPIFPDYVISYCDRNGFNTERRITIQRMDGDLIQAYCHLRHDRRSFYVSRASQWVNCSSGEVVSDIFEDLAAARKSSVYGVIDRMFEEFYPIMGVLLYLCKGDRRLMINERTILIRVFYQLCNDARLTDEAINDGINEMNVPSRTKYMSLVKQLSSMSDDIQSLTVESAKEIFASRKKLNPIEEEALKELYKRLGIEKS